MPEPILDQINLVCANLDASIAFYRALGLHIPDESIWKTDSGPHHVEIEMKNGLELALDSQALAKEYNEGSSSLSKAGNRNLLGFRLETRIEVDTLHANLIDLGYRSSQNPYDTFWGSRYAIIEDPDGNQVGLMSPPDPELRSGPPSI
jgi:catechol 2,3-dioxygenase-like lactoylglutathione lyase family enzyme